MSRHRPSGSYGHRIRKFGQDYLISWTVDRYYKGCRQRFPRAAKRCTDKEGAMRFAKKWGLAWQDESVQP